MILHTYHKLGLPDTKGGEHDEVLGWLRGSHRGIQKVHVPVAVHSP